MTSSTPKGMKEKPNGGAPIVFRDFNGISDSLWQGPHGSFYKMVGLDIHSKRGALQVQQTLAKDSGTTITDLCKVGITVSDGSFLWFSYTTGKIWRQSGGTYTLVYTTVPTTGTAFCEGAKEYNGNIYWATQNYLHYVPVANISNFAGVVPNFKLFGATDPNWHPMEVVNAKLFIGDNHQVATVDSSNTFTANALDLIAPNVIKCMKAYDIDLVIGTLINLAVNRSWIVRWDTVQTSWQFMEPVGEDGVNCLFWSGQNLLANAGQYGMIYHYNGRNLVPHQSLPAINNKWSPSHNGEILPNAADIWGNFAVFGFTANNGNPIDSACYLFGSYSSQYPSSLDESFPISSGNLSSITIGAVVASNQNLYVAWQDTVAGTQGVDKLNWSALYASAFIETVAINIEEHPEMSIVVQTIFALYQSLPAGTSVSLSYYSNWGSKTSPTNSINTDTNRQVVWYDEGIEDVRTIRLRMDFVVSQNSGPVIEAFGLLPAP